MNEIILHTAFDQLLLQKIIGKWEPLDHKDGKVEISFQGRVHKVFVVVKKELRHHQLPNIFELADKSDPLIVVAEKIFPKLKEILRERGIGYLDTAGNFYMNTKGIFLWVDGQKPKINKLPTNRAFTKTGLKTVFYLLMNKDAVNMPHRELAKASDVALGNIKNIIDGLRQEGFILQINKKNIQLQNKKKLLDRWLVGYMEILKPALQFGRYRFWDQENIKNWQTLPIEEGDTVWSGEPAAEYYTNYLVPATLTAYTLQKNKLVTKWKLIPDEAGNVHLFSKFWKDDQVSDKLYAPPLLVYADLLQTGDPRCIETALRIYDKYLKNEFE